MRLSRIALLSLAALATALASVAILVWVAARTSWIEHRIAAVLSGEIGVPVAVGELAIGYFPSPYVAATDVVLGPAPGADAPTATLAALRVELPWKTVLGRALQVERIEVASPVVNLAVDEAGRDNWTALVDGFAELGDGDDESGPVDWSVGVLELSAGTLGFGDARDGTAVSLTAIAVEARDVAPRERFGLKSRAAGQVGEYTFHAAVDGWIRLDPDTDSYAGEQWSFRGWLGGGELGLGGVELAGGVKSLAADLAAGTVDVQGLEFEGLGLRAGGELSVTGLDSAPSVAFSIETEPFAPRAVANSVNRPLPETASPAAFARAELSVRGRSDAVSGWSIDQLAGQLDDSRFEGSAVLPAGGGEPPRLRLDVDRIALDGYLPPDTGESATPQEIFTAMVDALNALDIDAEITVGRAEAAGAAVQGLRIRVEPDDRAPPAADGS
jgi:AsmA protein